MKTVFLRALGAGLRRPLPESRLADKRLADGRLPDLKLRRPTAFASPKPVPYFVTCGLISYPFLGGARNFFCLTQRLIRLLWGILQTPRICLHIPLYRPPSLT